MNVEKICSEMFGDEIDDIVFIFANFRGLDEDSRSAISTRN